VTTRVVSSLALGRTLGAGASPYATDDVQDLVGTTRRSQGPKKTRPLHLQRAHISGAWLYECKSETMAKGSWEARRSEPPDSAP